MDELVEGADSLKYKKHKQSKSDNCVSVTKSYQSQTY